MVQDPAERLAGYRAKRHFARTPEPSGQAEAIDVERPRFVVQKHAARRLHYDLRLEAEGVLVSWAVPKGPSYDPGTKRLAVHVEDHPLDYRDFEGTIPGGEYGAGAVIVWDRGTFENLTERRGRTVSVRDAVTAGHVSVRFEGSKLRGGWSLTRTGGGGRESWILVKRRDETADPDRDVTAAEPNSVETNRSLDEVAAAGEKGEGEQWTAARATWRPPMQPCSADRAEHPAVGWLYERRRDGVRMVAVRNDDRVELWSAGHDSLTDQATDVVTALAAVPATSFTLDGVLVGGSYQAFDLIELLGRDTTALALTARRQLLAQALEGVADAVSVVDDEPGELRAAAGGGGVIAKRADSTYRSGLSPDWLILDDEQSP